MRKLTYFEYTAEEIQKIVLEHYGRNDYCVYYDAGIVFREERIFAVLEKQRLSDDERIRLDEFRRGKNDKYLINLILQDLVNHDKLPESTICVLCSRL